MHDPRLVMNYAEDLNEIFNKDEIREYYMKQSPLVMEQVFNHIVILLTMCVNKELHLAFDVEDEDIGVEEYPNRMEEIYEDILFSYKMQNSKIVGMNNIPIKEKNIFLLYLNNMTKCLLSGVKYIRKKDDEWHPCVDEVNEWNTRYRREERVRDYMKELISVGKPFTKFTITHNIEIPYMYVLAWDLHEAYKHFFDDPLKYEKDSYRRNLLQNTKIELEYISDNLMDILLYASQIDKDDIGKSLSIHVQKRVDYTSLLPTISIGEKVDYNNDLVAPKGRTMSIARKTHNLPYIKKEVLKRVPLFPMEVDQNEFESRKSLEIMIAYMKGQDNLKHDLVYISKHIVIICKKILDWVWKNDSDFTRIGKEKAEKYLISMIKTVENLPREDNDSNRESYINNLVNIIAKQWDASSLKSVETNNEDSESYITYAYFSVLKLARNWNEHNLFQNVSMTFAIFLFLISIRYLIKLDCFEYEKYVEFMYEEAKLFKYLGTEKILYDNIRKEELEKEYITMYKYVNTSICLSEGYSKWAKLPKDKSEKRPHQVLNTAGFTKSKIKNEMSEYEIYLAFWLTVHMGDNNKLIKIGRTRDINIIEILERTFYYQKQSKMLK